MTDTLYRQWTMLRQIPLQPKKIPTSQLQKALADAGFEIDLRSIQRDLHKLTDHFPLICDDHKPAGWSWRRETPAFELPGMEMHAALAWQLAGAHVLTLLPEATRVHLQPYLQRADHVLAHLNDNRLSQWPTKVRVLEPGLALLPPKIDHTVQEAVERALFGDLQLQVSYRKRGDEKIKTYPVHPLALVWRGAVGYLVATIFDYTDVLQLALHRVTHAEVIAKPRNVPDGFALDTYIASGAFDFVVNADPVQLVVRVHDYALTRLVETPLAPDQTIEATEPPWSVVRATMADTTQLRMWLRSHGDMVQVLQPEALRQEMGAVAARTAALYAASPVPAT